MAASQEARLGEADEDDDAHLSPTAIGRGRCGTAAMARRARARVSVPRENTERARGRGREGKHGREGRGARGGPPYPRSLHGMDGDGALERPRGSLQRKVGDDRMVF